MFHSKKSNIIASWWWCIDRSLLIAIFALICFSAIMTTTASPAVAERIGLEPMYFLKRQMVFLSLSILVMVFFSIIDQVTIRRIAFVGFIACLFMLVIVLVIGTEVKGAKRWLNIVGFSLQPSEFIKPFFAVTIAWILAKRTQIRNFASFKISLIIYVLVAGLIVLQPDLGMAITISCVFAVQMFLAGISMAWVLLGAFGAIFSLIIAYFFLPHVTKRINGFLNPAESENYQIKKSLEAFSNGGIFGTGPGDGTVKRYLPDSHTDFIFSVIGEELGMIVCLVIIAVYAFVVVRALLKLVKEQDLFVIYAASGIITQFAMQSIINIGVTLHLMPTKGMTLPFISYGGSSTLSLSIAIGILLGITKKKYGVKQNLNNINNRIMNYHGNL